MVDKVSLHGAFAVLRFNELALLDTRSFAFTPLRFFAVEPYPTDDGAFLRFLQDDARFAYRVSDGRILGYLPCPECAGGHVVMTDEGVVSAPQDASSYAVRRGPNVLRSSIELMTSFPSDHVRPTLEADFFAGNSVSIP
jgi:hypothetical protein